MTAEALDLRTVAEQIADVLTALGRTDDEVAANLRNDNDFGRLIGCDNPVARRIARMVPTTARLWGIRGYWLDERATWFFGADPAIRVCLTPEPVAEFLDGFYVGMYRDLVEGLPR